MTLLSDNSSAVWSEVNTLLLVPPDRPYSFGKLEISSQVESLQSGRGANASATLDAGFYPTQGDDHGPGGYLVATGHELVAALRECTPVLGLSIGEPPFEVGAAPQEVPEQTVAEVDKTSVSARLSDDDVAYFRLTRNIYCSLPTSYFWNKQGAQYTFVTPRLKISSSFTRDWESEEAFLDGASRDCAAVRLGRGPGVVQQSIFPAAPPKGRAHVDTYDLRENDIESESPADSCGSPPLARSPVDSETDTAVPAVTATVNDATQAGVINQDTFISGISLGVLGGIIVEIVSTIADNRGRRTNEPQRPKPQWTGTPRSTTNRDQFKLF